MEKFTNRLAHESSPYLLQHAHNPVDWYPWGDEAFQKAQKENKPILLSIGYSTCHWCHVMERESFEDPEIARVMNENYVPIKLDREQRPDVDAVYMAAVQMMTGQGGWPMTMWLTPNREPFYGGTYFPPRDGERGMRIGFLSLLRRLADVYREHPEEVVKQAGEMRQALRAQTAPDLKGSLSPALLHQTYASFQSQFDGVHGGFGFAPKFPRPGTFTFLLQYGFRTGNHHAYDMAIFTLDKMARGGMYDQIGGGFHRYSTDPQWLVPHFEKMLYDNAQLVVSYLEAYQITGEERFSRIARETLDYVAREMTDSEGGFYSATDADSEGHEGTFFVWTQDEIEKVLGNQDASLLCEFYGVTPEGNFEGKNILSVVVPIDEFARKLKMPLEELAKKIDTARAKLYEVRRKRIPPHTDDKILTAWNGLMLGAFARAGFILNESTYIEYAVRCARFILEKLCANRRLHRSYRKGKIDSPAFLDDFAFLTWGLLELFETTQDVQWLEEAKRFQDELLSRFWDEGRGGFFMTSPDHEPLLAREKPYYDGAEPSGNAVAAFNLSRLYALTEDERYQAAFEKTLQTFSGILEQAPSIAPVMLAAFQTLLDPLKQVALISPSTEIHKDPLLEMLRKTYFPNCVLGRASQLPWLQGRVVQEGKPTAYVCQNHTCGLPTTDPQALSEQLRKTASLQSQGT